MRVRIYLSEVKFMQHVKCHAVPENVHLLVFEYLCESI